MAWNETYKYANRRKAYEQFEGMYHWNLKYLVILDPEAQIAYKPCDFHGD